MTFNGLHSVKSQNRDSSKDCCENIKSYICSHYVVTWCAEITAHGWMVIYVEDGWKGSLGSRGEVETVTDSKSATPGTDWI
jgi:hypothetical protein